MERSLSPAVRAGVVRVVVFLALVLTVAGLVLCFRDVRWGIVPFCVGVGLLSYHTMAAMARSGR